MNDWVLRRDEDGVRVLTLNRPDKRNALHAPLRQALLQALGDAQADPQVRCLVLAGAGRSFCAGADLDEHREAQGGDALRQRVEEMAQLQLAMTQLSVPVVSAVQGAAVGAGAGLAIGGDIVVIAEDARIGYPEVPKGMVPTLMFPTVLRQVGRRAAFELLVVGGMVDAARAVTLGLANEAVPAERLAERCLAHARQLAQMDPATVRAAKQLFYRVADLPLEEGMRVGVAATLA